jgi:hypothetical protein
MSREKLAEKGREVRHWRLHRRPNDTLGDLAEAINPIVRGSPGVVKLSHDVAPDVRRGAFATRLDRCGGRSCR